MNKPLRNGQISEEYRECKNCNTWDEHTKNCMTGRATPIIPPDVKIRKVSREPVTHLTELI